MKTEEVPVLIIGCSFMATGIAEVLKEKCRIVQRGMIPGEEFTGTYRPGKEWGQELSQAWIKEFKEELKQRNVLGEGDKTYLPGLLPTLYGLIKRRALPVDFMTSVIQINKIGNRIETVLTDASGCYKVRSRLLIDTTMDGLLSEGKKIQRRKSIHALVHSASGMELSGLVTEEKDLKMSACNCSEELNMSFPLAFEDTIVDARKKLYEFWTNRPKELSDLRIDVIAPQIEQQTGFFHREICPNWDWYPGQDKNPLAGMEYGTNLGQSLLLRLNSLGVK